jgi:aminomethyltransferase
MIDWADPYYHFEVADFAGFEHVIISATGYTGSGGFEIYCNDQVETIWIRFWRSAGIKPVGLAARDTLTEMGFAFTEMTLTIPPHR